MLRICRSILAGGLFFSCAGLPGQTGTSGPGTSLNEFPTYVPAQQVSGVIRNNGSAFAGLLAAWEAGFKKYHPGITFQDSLLSGDAAIGALEAGASDLAPNGREPVLTEFLSFAEVFNNDGPFQVTVGTGSYEALGRTWAQVIFVNNDNPLTHLTMKQLDQIFGAERTGGYSGYKWVDTPARPASENIRTWGQLGLTGEWANKPIQTYGYAPTGMSNFFELTVFHGGTKWNPNLRQYVEASAKQATTRAGTTDQMMDDLSHDRYGIAWAGLAHARNKRGVKSLALSTSSNGPFISCNEQTVRNRTYPLTRSIYFQLNRAPETPLEPRIKEFLLYVLSREGQALIDTQGEYLPLTTAELYRQRSLLK
ncbi:MAG: phosphate ABC transporter substrate-binding protein [Acidobacteriota bacterium]|nr:phosphate ABC transporter substrate-binding protein [Acidobacteriota bacterium]